MDQEWSPVRSGEKRRRWRAPSAESQKPCTVTAEPPSARNSPISSTSVKGFAAAGASTSRRNSAGSNRAASAGAASRMSSAEREDRRRAAARIPVTGARARAATAAAKAGRPGMYKGTLPPPPVRRFVEVSVESRWWSLARSSRGGSTDSPISMSAVGERLVRKNERRGEVLGGRPLAAGGQSGARAATS